MRNERSIALNVWLKQFIKEFYS